MRDTKGKNPSVLKDEDIFTSMKKAYKTRDFTNPSYIGFILMKKKYYVWIKYIPQLFFTLPQLIIIFQLLPSRFYWKHPSAFANRFLEKDIKHQP